MEETFPIIHSRLVRRNRNCSKNPYGADLSLLRDTSRGQARNDSARTGAYAWRRRSTVIAYPEPSRS